MYEFDPTKVQGVGPHSYNKFSQSVSDELVTSIRADAEGNIHQIGKVAAPVEPEDGTIRAIDFVDDDEGSEWFDEEFEAIQHRISNGDIIKDRIDRLRSGYQESVVEKAAEAKSVLSDPDINPINLMLEMDMRWPEWKEWEPETILSMSETDGVEIARPNQDKLMAIKVIFKQPDFFDSARVFEKVCVAFSGRIVDWGHIQEVRVHDIAATIALVTRFVMDLDFSDDVKAYIAASAIRDGYLILPENLAFADLEFTQKLVEVLGDDALSMQDDILSAISSEEITSEEQNIQLLRYVRCSRHVAEKLSEVSIDR